MAAVSGGPAGARVAQGREQQRELYGAPLGDRVRRLTAALGISQARLARTLGISPAMLSQLVSGRRVKIGDPAVLARMMLLDQRCHTVVSVADVEAWRSGQRSPWSPALSDYLAGEVMLPQRRRIAHWGRRECGSMEVARFRLDAGEA